MAVSDEECCASSQSESLLPPSSTFNPKGVHYLAKCVLKGSAVLQVVYGHIRSFSSLDIVLGKETSIELVIIDEDGIVQSLCEQPVFGTIKDIAILRWNEKIHEHNSKMFGKDILVVLSDSGKLSFLSFSNEMHRFFPVEQIQMSNPGNSTYQLGRMLAVDSSGCFVAVSAYRDRLAIFSVSTSVGRSELIDKRICYPSEISEDTNKSYDICGTIWSMCFISKDLRQPCKDYSPLLAILLNRKGASQNELVLLKWNTNEHHHVHIMSHVIEAGPLAHDIVEVPHCLGFAFIFRVGDVLLMDLRDEINPCCVYRTSLNLLTPGVEVDEHISFLDPCCFVHEDIDEEHMFNVAARALLQLSDNRMDTSRDDDDPMNIDDLKKPISKFACAWTWEPITSNTIKPYRMCLSVDTGEIFMIEISFDCFNEPVKVSLSECLYKCQKSCKALLWIEGGFLAAFVEMEDGIVLKLEDEKLLLNFTSLIQNISPILDVSVVDCHDEKHDQIFACCGVAPEGSLRIIRSGISVDELYKTPPNYQGITGTWTIKMRLNDNYHSFLVLSFVEETRVLSVGLSFSDLTDLVGFRPDVCTLACGLVDDGLLVQIYQNAIKLCLPTKLAYPEGTISCSTPICTSWPPDNANISISLGAVGHNRIIVSTSNPCLLLILGVRSISKFHHEMYEMQRVILENELSCISIPLQQPFEQNIFSIATTVFVIGTHKSSVEVIAYLPEKGIKVIAAGTVCLKNTKGIAISGCVPQDVRLVHVDRYYVLSGLRNGMLLRLEWPSVEIFHQHLDSLNNNKSDGMNMSPSDLNLIAMRRIGIMPVFLVSLSDSLDSDIIALSDRPWLLHTARHGLSFTSISVQPSTHVTPVRFVDCPMGFLFVSDNGLHLVEMVHSRRLNVQKFELKGTPRKILYHSESKLLLVMRNDLDNDTCSSDICFVDPRTGSVLSSFKLKPGEIGKCMELIRVGNEQVLVIGTSLFSGPAIMPSGEAESTKGRLFVLCLENMRKYDSGRSKQPCSSSQQAEQLCSSTSPDDVSCDGKKLEEELEAWNFRVAYSSTWPGMVLAICPYLYRYFLASAGNIFYVCGFTNDKPEKVTRFAKGITRFMIMSLTTHFTRIVVGNCRDGVLFYAYHENSKNLEQVYSDPAQRLVADCMLVNEDTVVVSDRKGSIAVLSCTNNLQENANPESNLTMDCSYYMGEIAMKLKKISFPYQLPADDMLKDCKANTTDSIIDASHDSFMATTLLGSIFMFLPLSSDEYELLEWLQAKLVVHPLTAPVLGNDHREFRSRENPAKVRKILDGDMLCQFLELTSKQQEEVISSSSSSHDLISWKATTMSSKHDQYPPIPMNQQVVQLLERVHHALN